MNDFAHHATVQSDGVVTHVLVPVDEYQRLTSAQRPSATPPSDRQIDEAIATLNDPRTTWHDGEEVLRTVLRDGIERARRVRKLSQGELGKRVGLSQPQMSRIENQPENATLAVLRRIADALADGSAKPAKRGAGKKGSGKRSARG